MGCTDTVESVVVGCGMAQGCAPAPQEGHRAAPRRRRPAAHIQTARAVARIDFNSHLLHSRAATPLNCSPSIHSFVWPEKSISQKSQPLISVRSTPALSPLSRRPKSTVTRYRGPVFTHAEVEESGGGAVRVAVRFDETTTEPALVLREASCPKEARGCFRFAILYLLDLVM